MRKPLFLNGALGGPGGPCDPSFYTLYGDGNVWHRHIFVSVLFTRARITWTTQTTQTANSNIL
jgi:hypothetical protein